jgi:hypothetical protein
MTFSFLCDNFCINTMLGSSLPPVVCRRVHVLFTPFVLLVYSVVLCFFCFFFVLCTLCCPFPWIAHFLLPIRYSPWSSSVCQTLCQLECTPYSFSDESNVCLEFHDRFGGAYIMLWLALAMTVLHTFFKYLST